MYLVLMNDTYRDLDVLMFSDRDDALAQFEKECKYAKRKAADGGNEIRVTLLFVGDAGYSTMESRDHNGADEY